jgi:predicted ester cyclase
VPANSSLCAGPTRATQRRGELFDVEATGRQVEVRSITIYRIDRGLVRHEEGAVDHLSLMTQLQVSSGL